MTISWETRSGDQYKLLNDGGWQAKETTTASCKLSLEQLLLRGGTLKIGDTSIQIPDKSSLSNNIPAIKTALDSLEPSQASTGPTNALKKGLTEELDKQIQKSETRCQELAFSIGKDGDRKHTDLPGKPTPSDLFTKYTTYIDQLESRKQQLNSPSKLEQTSTKSESSVQQPSSPADQPTPNTTANQGTESNKWVSAKPTTAQAPQTPQIGNHKLDNPTIETQAQHPGIPTANPLETAKANLKSIVNPAIENKDMAVATYKALHPTPIEGPENMKELNEATLEEWKRQGIVDKDGNLDFTKLGNPPLSAREVRKAHLKGKVWIDETGKFEMKVNFQFGETAYKALKNLKEKANSDFEPKGEHSPISIDPRAARELSAADLAILKDGGQIRFLALEDGRMLKITAPLGEKDASKATLKIKIFGDATAHELGSLSEVFKNLKNWRELAGKMAIKKEIDGIPFTSRFDVIKQSNEDDPERIQAENAIWEAIYAYLATTINQPAKKSETTQQQNTKPDEVQGTVAREINTSEDISENSKKEIASKTPVSTAAEQAKEVGEQNPFPDDFQGIFNAAKNIPNLNLRPNKEPEVIKAQKINIEESPEITAKRVSQVTMTKVPTREHDYSDLIGAGQDLSNALNGLKRALDTAPTATADDVAVMNSEASRLEDLNVNLQTATPISQNLPPDEQDNALDAAKEVSSAAQELTKTETPPQQTPTIIRLQTQHSESKAGLLDAAKGVQMATNRLVGALSQAVLSDIAPTPTPVQTSTDSTSAPGQINTATTPTP